MSLYFGAGGVWSLPFPSFPLFLGGGDDDGGDDDGEVGNMAATDVVLVEVKEQQTSDQ
eukprot:m.175555 g.175555  ORF g.175555 m.175555 type:complete len:58 (-) comp13518_c2_seq4:256-429(-)